MYVPKQGIDYTSIHLWPDNWGQSDIDFARYWITNHTANAQTLGDSLLTLHTPHCDCHGV